MCTDVACTALDVALSLPFAEAVACVDWVLWRRNEHQVTVERIRRQRDLLSPRNRRARAGAVICFATHLSDSFEEFDGKSKYLRQAHGRPQSPEEVVWREKKRRTAAAADRSRIWRMLCRAAT